MEPTAQVLATDTELGPKAFRRRSRQPGAFASVTFRFLETDYVTFIEWWKTDLRFGLKWFWIKLPSAGGITWHVSRFAERYRATLDGHRYWNVTAKLELRERQFYPNNNGETFEIDLEGVANAGFTSANGVTIAVDSTARYAVNVVSRRFMAWSRFANAAAAGGPDWECNFRITDPSGTTDYLPSRYTTPAAANAAASAFTVEITGQNSYTFWLFDNLVSDNREGLSLTVTRMLN